jgi:hypothetical protein
VRNACCQRLTKRNRKTKALLLSLRTLDQWRTSDPGRAPRSNACTVGGTPYRGTWEDPQTSLDWHSACDWGHIGRHLGAAGRWRRWKAFQTAEAGGSLNNWLAHDWFRDRSTLLVPKPRVAGGLAASWYKIGEGPRERSLGERSSLLRRTTVLGRATCSLPILLIEAPAAPTGHNSWLVDTRTCTDARCRWYQSPIAVSPQGRIAGKVGPKSGSVTGGETQTWKSFHPTSYGKRDRSQLEIRLKIPSVGFH